MKKEVTKLLLHKLRTASYRSEELLGECWSVNCGDCQYPEVNKAFEEAKKTLLNLAHVTEKALQKVEFDKDNLYPEVALRQAKDLVGDLGSNIDEDEMYDKAISWQYDEDGDEYYLSSNGNRYYLFSKVVTLKGDRQSTIYTFGKKEWNKYPFSTNGLTLLRFYNIPYDKCVVENKSGYPFLKTDVGQVGVDAEDSINKELQKQFKTPKWDL